MLRTRENYDVFKSLNEIYLVCTSKKRISSVNSINALSTLGDGTTTSIYILTTLDNSTNALGGGATTLDNSTALTDPGRRDTTSQDPHL